MPADLRRAQVGHARVVRAVVGDRARCRRASPARRSGARAPACPGSPTAAPAGRRARTGGTGRLDGGVVRKRGSIAGSVAGRRDLPRLARVGDEEVAQQDHRRAVGDRDPHRLVDRLEALPGRRGGEHRQRRLAVAPVQRLQQVRLLGLGRHAGRRPGALDVDDHHRQLEHHRQADRLGLEVQPRTARARHAQRAAERRAQRHRRGRDLVLGLDRAHAQVLPARRARAAGPTRA